MSEGRGLSPDETLTMLYDLALRVAEGRGATIPDSARGTGAYAFLDIINSGQFGNLTITYDDRPAQREEPGGQ